MENIISPNYGDANRAFLQAVMARGTVTFEESRSIVAAILNAENQEGGTLRHDQITEETVSDFIDVASQAASLFDFEIRHAAHQTSNERVYALVNTASDPQTQLATTYSADQLSFIKRMFDAMFETYNSARMEIMAITEMQAIKLARPNRRQSQPEVEEGTQAPVDKGLKHSEVEDVLASMVEGGWLERSGQKFYTLSPRGLLELRPWLTETYNDPDAEAGDWQRIKTCAACKDLITVGLRCSEPTCIFRLHDVCQDAFWRARRDKTCPMCSKAWTGTSYVGERAVTETEAYRRGRPRPNGASTGQRSTQAGENYEDEDDE
jgi:hypothetical protein